MLLLFCVEQMNQTSRPYPTMENFSGDYPRQPLPEPPTTVVAAPVNQAVESNFYF